MKFLKDMMRNYYLFIEIAVVTAVICAAAATVVTAYLVLWAMIGVI